MLSLLSFGIVSLELLKSYFILSLSYVIITKYQSTLKLSPKRKSQNSFLDRNK